MPQKLQNTMPTFQFLNQGVLSTSVPLSVVNNYVTVKQDSVLSCGQPFSSSLRALIEYINKLLKIFQHEHENDMYLTNQSPGKVPKRREKIGTKKDK